MFAAFDRPAVFYKLIALGISTELIAMMKNMYGGTSTSVWTKHVLSETFETIAGVKQGCILSPLLIFIVFKRYKCIL